MITQHSDPSFLFTLDVVMTWSIHLIICFFYREHRKMEGDEDKDNPETDDIL